ncbi:MAG TPA: hydroxyisourate hydrolase [Thermoanaerobaculia bacterium]|nr:hydroxyisourate hydrolase [Thermoanaerobaculia bacterium]
MAGITTHVLDTSRGRPAAGVAIHLELRSGEQWKRIGTGATDEDGRLRNLISANEALTAGTYRLVFATGEYFRNSGVEHFFPEVTILFRIDDPDQHYHVPLLLSPYGYSTYRGS